MWAAIKALMKPNDYVLIEFGHNDKQTPQAQFELYLNKYISETQALGGIPVLVTPIARASFNGNTLGPQHINDLGSISLRAFDRSAQRTTFPSST